MPFIQNIAAADLAIQFHKDIENNAVLIQIMDNNDWWPVSPLNFKEIHKFIFLDNNTDFTDVQARQMVAILQRALDSGANVLVHCHAGLCRSGAVCEVGTIMGFDDTGRRRQPNVIVKTKMLKVLGLTYDS